MTSFV